MTTWIETSKTHQNGEPVTRKIKIPSMNQAIWFTDQGYAEVSDDVADILANNLPAISKTSVPSSPGSYYGDPGQNTITEIVVADGAYDALTVESLDADSTNTDTLSVTNGVTAGSIDTPESRTNSRTVTINVPSDFNSISNALDEIQNVRHSPGLRFEIIIESGHNVGRWDIVDADLRHVTISSVDNIVNVDTGLSATLLWTAKNAVAPRMNVLVDLQGESYYGFRAKRNASIYVNPGCGFVNGQRGFNINSGSKILGDNDGTTGLISRGHSERGVALTDGSTGRFDEADLTNNTNRGVRVAGGSIASVSYSDVSGCEHGVRVSGTGFIAIQDSVGNNCDRFVSCKEGTVLVRGASVDSPGTTGIDADSGGRILASGITITNAGFVGAMAQDGGQVVVNEGSITGSANDDIRSVRGGIASTHNCTTTNSSSGQPHTNDVSHTGFHETDGIVFGNFET